MWHRPILTAGKGEVKWIVNHDIQPMIGFPFPANRRRLAIGADITQYSQRTMSQKLKVLISAYACEPGKGSEPEVGWQLALHMAKFHDITVVTRANNQPTIEKGLATYDGPQPQFIYYDLPQWVLALKRRGMWIAIYYIFWQLGVRFHVRKQLGSFDLIHHATFNSFRQPGSWWFCPKPVVLGPLGGGQICPWRFLPWFRTQILYELFRSLSVVNSFIFPHIYLSFFFADKILIANKDTGQCVPWLFRGKIERMLETGMTEEQIAESKPERNWSGVRFLWISRLDKMKGGELAIRAFAQAASKFPGMTLTVVGGGPEEKPLRRLIRTLALEKSVIWQGRVPKAQITDFIQRHDAFVFTSLRDTSGNVVLEAMAVGLPVVTFRHHGAVEITTDETALRVPITSRSETLTQMSNAMLTLAQSPALRDKMGAAGRERIKEKYLWKDHAERMDRIYHQVFEEERITSAKQQKAWHTIWSPKGILLTIAALLLIGTLGFYSVTYLKHQARLIVTDTLPGLSYAGAANANLAEGFNRTALILMTENPDERARYREEIEEFNRITTVYLNAYGKTIFDEKHDRNLYKTLIQRRNQYLELRKQMLDLIDNRQQPEAIALWKTSLLPAYKHYKESGEALLDYNMRLGQMRGESIMRYCILTQYLVAAFGIGLFIVGFMLGFFK